MNLTNRNKDLKDFFDEKAEGYDDVHTKFMASKAAITSALPEGTVKVLDLGGGTGLELIPLFERFPDAEVTVIDLSDEMMSQIGKRSFSDRVRCVCGNFFDEPFENGYDAVISTSSLHHFTPESKAALYKKVYECLSDGGVFINSDKCVETDEQQAEWFSIYENSPDCMRHIDTPLTPENEKRVLSEVGFGGISCSPTPNDDYYLIIGVKPRHL